MEIIKLLYVIYFFYLLIYKDIALIVYIFLKIFN